MIFEIPKQDREIIRALAKKQAELAALPVMGERQKLWTGMNDGVSGARPPFAIESWTFDRDFLPENLLKCSSNYGRQLERTLLRNIRHHEVFNDDHVCPDSFEIGWHVTIDDYGVKIETERVEDSEGVETAYHFKHPITDLNEGFDMVKPATWSLDRESTLEEKAFLEELFGEFLPVVVDFNPSGLNYLTQRLMRLMSMDTFFMAMYDCPDKLHELLAMQRDNAIRIGKWAESEGLLRLNNGNQCTCGTCFNFTNILPKREISSGDTIRLSDRWTGMDSQETVGVSPDMFLEQIFPHYKAIAELYGLVYWGCCEPADPIWEKSLSNLPNLKAVSVSRWANQEYMADVLAGKNIVYSRKPNPNLLGVDVKLDEDAWAAEIRSTLEVTVPRNIPTEFVVRDVYSMHGNLGKARRATEIARREIERFF